MHGVHQIGISLDGVLGGEVYALVPRRAAHEDEGLRRVLGADGGYHLGGVVLELLPVGFHGFFIAQVGIAGLALEGVADRLVEELVYDVGHALVAAGYAGEELYCLIGVEVVRMPVHDDVAAGAYGLVDEGVEAFQGESGFLDVAVMAIGIVDPGMSVGADGGPEYAAAPVVAEGGQGPGVVETGPDIVPAETHSVPGDGSAACGEGGAFDFEGCHFGGFVFAAGGGRYQ